MLAAEPRVRTLLLTGGNPFLEGALGANPGVALDILNPSAWQPAMNSGFDVVVYDNWLPEGFSPDAPGARGSLFLGKSPFAAPGETAVAPIAETVDAASPLLWNVGLDAVRIFQSGSLTLPTDGRWRTNIVLANAGQPILATLEQPGGARMVAAAFAVPDSNMPLRAAFPLFMSNAVRWLAGRAGSDTPNRRAGEIFVPGPKVEISTGPRETADTSKPADTAPSLTGAPLRLGKNGFYEVREPGGSRWLAVNTTDARESDLRAATRRAALLATVHAGLALWQWLAIAAAALLVTEWYLHHRRVTE